jgi:hypothetical protein
LQGRLVVGHRAEILFLKGDSYHLKDHDLGARLAERPPQAD